MNTNRIFDLEDRLIDFSIETSEILKCNELIAIFLKSMDTANKNRRK